MHASVFQEMKARAEAVESRVRELEAHLPSKRGYEMYKAQKERADKAEALCAVYREGIQAALNDQVDEYSGPDFPELRALYCLWEHPDPAAEKLLARLRAAEAVCAYVTDDFCHYSVERCAKGVESCKCGVGAMSAAAIKWRRACEEIK